MTTKPITYLLSALTLVVPFVYLPEVFDFTRHPRLFVIQLALLTCGIWLMLKPHATKASREFFLVLAGWAGWSLLSTLWATNPIEALIQAQRIVIFMLVTLTVCNLSDSQQIKSIYLVASIAGGLVSLIGICQYFGWAFNTIPTVGNPSATFGYRNFAASYLVVLLPATMGFALTEESSRKRWILLISATSMALFLAYTRTRGAWLGFGVAILTTVTTLTLLHFRYNTPLPLFQFVRQPILLALTALICIVGSFSEQMEQTGKFKFDERKADVTTALSTAFSPSDSRGRLTVWYHTLEMIMDTPIRGVGLGSWQYIYPTYDKGDWITDNAAPQRPHNDLLWIFAETGIVGFGLYVSLFLILAKQVWQTLRTSASHSLWLIGIGTGILALLGHSFFSFPQERPAPALLFWLGIGAVAHLTQTTKTQVASLRPVYILSLPILALGLCFTYFQFQFDRHYLQAHLAWRSQNWSLLLSSTSEALSYGPMNYRAYLLQGAAYQQLGKTTEAIHAYKQAQIYHPNEGHLALAQALLANENYTEALTHLRIEHKLYPDSDDAKKELGNTLLIVGTQYQRQQNYSQAEKAYLEAQIFHPNDPRVDNNLGSIYLARSEFRKAEQAFLNALKKQPAYAHAYHNLGDLYTALKDSVRAINAYQKFIETWQGDHQMIELAKQKQSRLLSRQ